MTVSVIVGAIVARLNELRTRASLAAREAELRVRVTNELLAGREPSAVADATCEALVDLFGLESCEFPDADGPRSLVITYGRPLQPYELATLGALDAGLNAAFDRARLDAEAREHQLAAEVDRSRASFLAAITHDLRTPLATIKAANAALLASDASMDANDRHDLLDASYREASRLEQLVTTALELTRIHAEDSRPNRSRSRSSIWCVPRCSDCARWPRDREIVLDVSPELPAAYVDSVMLEHAVENVLENALRHGPPDRDIRVTGACSDDWVQLRVIDHGVGVAAEDRERVFEEFVQLGDADGSGVGLGLSITRAFVESNGGSVRFEETPGGGATLVLVLPAASFGGCRMSRVLLVEDDVQLRRALRASFRFVGLRREGSGVGRRGAHRRCQRGPRPRRARPRTARHRRLDDAAPSPVVHRRAGRGAHRARRTLRQGRRARVGCRRLHGEAVRARRSSSPARARICAGWSRRPAAASWCAPATS